MQENAKTIIEDSLKIGNQVKIVDSKSLLEEIEAAKKMGNGHQITIGTTKDGMIIEKVSKDCRKSGMIFLSPFSHSHNGKLNTR